MHGILRVPILIPKDRIDFRTSNHGCARNTSGVIRSQDLKSVVAVMCFKSYMDTSQNSYRDASQLLGRGFIGIGILEEATGETCPTSNDDKPKRLRENSN